MIEPKLQRQEFFGKILSMIKHDIELRALPSKKRVFTMDIPTIEKFVADNINENLYFGVYTRKGGGTKEHIQEVTCYFTDFDFKLLNGGEDEAWEILRNFEFKPTYIIYSGGGLHCYWFFSHCIEPSEKVERVLRGLAKHLKADPNVAELARIMRIPGTYNYKYNEKKLVTLTDLTDFLYEPEVFDKFEDKTIFTETFVRKDIDEIIQEINQKCNFLKHCFEHSQELPEPLWYAMVSNLCRYPNKPFDLVHEYSRNYRRYSPGETEAKIRHALNDSGPHTCRQIKEDMKLFLGFDCGKNCSIKSPIILLKRKSQTEETTDDIQFPKTIMSGAAGLYAETMENYLESPAHFNYITFLVCLGTVLADKLTLNSEIKPQPRIYAVLLGESADERKSTAIKQAIEFFREKITGFNVCWGIGSAEGLQKRLETSPSLLLSFDEFRAFVSKCRLEGSVLLPCVNSLFENNFYESQTKHSQIKLESVYLSIIGASTIETYENTWDSNFTDIGFANRLFIVPGSSKRRFAIPENIPMYEKTIIAKRLSEILQFSNINQILSLDEDAKELYETWYENIRNERSIHAKRLDTYALRFMPLLAINDMKKTIDLETVEKTIQLMNWQLLVRKLYAPFDADNKIAFLEEKIRRYLSIKPHCERDIKRAVHYNRYGTYIFKQAMSNLSSDREIGFNKTDKEWFWRATT